MVGWYSFLHRGLPTTHLCTNNYDYHGRARRQGVHVTSAKTSANRLIGIGAIPVVLRIGPCDPVRRPPFVNEATGREEGKRGGAAALGGWVVGRYVGSMRMPIP